MSFRYTVRNGDNLSSIASMYGVRPWRELYNQPENAAFRCVSCPSGRGHTSKEKNQDFQKPNNRFSI